MTVASKPAEWYVSAYSAALTYHLLAVVLTLAELVRYSPDTSSETATLQLPVRNLAVFGAAFIVRAVIMQIPVREKRARRVVVGDTCAFAVIIAVFCVVSLPFDTSGAALLGVVAMTALGIPLVALTSALSILVSRRRWIATTLLALAVADLIALVLCSALQLIAQP